MSCSCSALGPHCGDGEVDEEFEACDDGDNLGGYNGCNPDCSAGASCGDGIWQPEFGEGCDAGSENGEPGSTCSDICTVVVQYETPQRDREREQSCRRLRTSRFCRIKVGSEAKKSFAEPAPACRNTFLPTMGFAGLK